MPHNETEESLPLCEFEGCILTDRRYTIHSYQRNDVVTYQWCRGHNDYSSYGCADCGRRYTQIEPATGDGYGLCLGCYEDNTNWCDDCDEAYRYIDDHNCGARRRRRSGVHSWDYVPYFIHHGEGPARFGLELEVGIPAWGNATYIHDSYEDSLYCKHDGSIEPEGFEIVSHPRSWDSWLEFEPQLAALTEYLKAQGQCGPNGIHVHVSRTAFEGRDHVMRWMELIHLNKERMSAYARRYSHRWAKFHNVENLDMVVDSNWSDNGKYVAVNTYHRDTYEVRVFAASLENEEILGSIGLVAASVEYTRDADNDHKDWDAFGVWCMEREEFRVVATQIVKSNDRLDEMVQLLAELDRPRAARWEDELIAAPELRARRFRPSVVLPAEPQEYAIMVNGQSVGTYSLGEQDFGFLESEGLRFVPLPTATENEVQAMNGFRSRLADGPITVTLSDTVSSSNSIDLTWFDETVDFA